MVSSVLSCLRAANNASYGGAITWIGLRVGKAVTRTAEDCRSKLALPWGGDHVDGDEAIVAADAVTMALEAAGGRVGL